MLVLGAHNKGRTSTTDKANIGNPKVNRGCHPLTSNRTSADCVENSFGPSVQYIPLGDYHTGSFNTQNIMNPTNTNIVYRWIFVLTKQGYKHQCLYMI